MLALSLRTGFLIGRGPELGGDTEDYLKLSSSITTKSLFGFESAQSHTVSMRADIPTIRRAPAYPLFLALVGGWKEPNPLIVALVQVLMDSIIASLIYLTLKSISPASFSLVAALLYALNPGAVIVSLRLMSEALFTFLLFCSVLLIGIGAVKDKIILSGVGGIFIGLTILCRAIALPLPIMFAIFLIFIPGLSNRVHHISIMIIMAIIVVTPWSIRCSYVANNLVLVQGVTAAQFYIPTRSDLNQKLYGQVLESIFGPETKDVYGRKVRDAKNSAEIVEADRIGHRQALENIKAAPRRYVISRVKCFPYLFLTSFDNFTSINASFADLLRERAIIRLFIKSMLLAVFSALPFVLALAGMCVAKRDPIVMLSVIVWVYTWLAHLPMWIEYRFWHPVVPCLLICAAVGVEKLRDRINKTRARVSNGNYCK